MWSNELSKIMSSKEGRIIVFCSGGKDSSYALYLVSRNADPSRVLAVTMDNGFLSDGARANIERLKNALGTSHEYWPIDPKIVFSFYRKLTECGNGSPRAVCVGCNILSELMEYEAICRHNPAFTVTGNTSSEYSLFQGWLDGAGIKGTGSGDSGFEYRHGMWQYNRRILKEVLPEGSPEYQTLAIPEPRMDDAVAKARRIGVFDYFEYDTARIYATLEAYGWRHPPDVVGTETDCTYTQAITFAYIKENSEAAYLDLLDRLAAAGDLDKADAKKAKERLSSLDEDLANSLLRKVGFIRNARSTPVLANAIRCLLPIR